MRQRGLEHEHVHADGWRDERDLGDHHHDDAEPDQIETMAHQEREEERDADQDDRQRLHHAAEQQEDEQDRHQGLVGTEPGRLNELQNAFAQARERDQLGEQQCAEQHAVEHHRGSRGLDEDLAKALPAHPPLRKGQDQRQAGTQTRGLGGGEQPAVQAADNEHEEQREGPHAAQRAQLLGDAGALAAGRILRADAGDRVDHAEIHHQTENAGDHGGDEEVADVGLGEDAVDHQDDRGRDQDAERAAGGDGGRGELIRVAVALHARVGDLGHRSRGREAGAAHRTETGAGHHGRQRQAAAHRPEESVRGAKQVVRDARAREDVAHQDEHRHHGELVGEHRLRDRHRHQRAGNIPAHDHTDAGERHRQQREGERHTQEGQDEHGQQGEESDRHFACSSVACE